MKAGSRQGRRKRRRRRRRRRRSRRKQNNRTRVGMRRGRMIQAKKTEHGIREEAASGIGRIITMSLGAAQSFNFIGRFYKHVVAAVPLVLSILLPRGPCDQNTSIPIEIFKPGLKFSIMIANIKPGSKTSSLRCFYLRDPPAFAEKGSFENFNPQSIARNVQSRRLRSRVFNPRALWAWGPK